MSVARNRGNHVLRPGPCIPLLLAAALAAASPGCRSGERAAARERSHAQHFDHDGLRVTMKLDAGDGRTVRSGARVGLRFAVQEAEDGGQPIAGLFPMGWLVKREAHEGPLDRAACKRLLRSLFQGRLSREAAVNLNEYHLVTLDDSNSISVIDPQIESSKTKTLGMISLPSKGVDFVLTPDRQTVLVSLERGGLVAAADLRRMRARHIDVGGRPRRVALQPDGALAWVGDFAGKGVTAIDAAILERRARVDVGPGPHELAFRADSRYMYVLSTRAQHAAALHLIDTQTLQSRQAVALGPGAIAVAASAHSRQLYVAFAHGTMEVLDDGDLTRAAEIELGAALAFFALSPDGRWGFALDREHDELQIIDTASNRVVHRMATRREPDRVDFTGAFAYVRHAGSEHYLLVDLSTLGQQARPQVATVVMGQAPPGRGQEASLGATLAPLPEGNGALLLNPNDRSVYHFMEGMLAPMGSYRLYPWPARGLLLADRSLREVEKGEYFTSFQAPRPGVYTVPFLVPTSPQIYDCSFTIEVEASPGEAPSHALRVETSFAGQTVEPGVDTTLELRIFDADTGAPLADLEDVMVLVFRQPRWQWRGPARAHGKGRYRVRLRFPEAGSYALMLQVPSRGVQFKDMPWMRVNVAAEGGAGPSRE